MQTVLWRCRTPNFSHSIYVRANYSARMIQAPKYRNFQIIIRRYHIEREIFRSMPKNDISLNISFTVLLWANSKRNWSLCITSSYSYFLVHNLFTYPSRFFFSSFLGLSAIKTNKLHFIYIFFFFFFGRHRVLTPTETFICHRKTDVLATTWKVLIKRVSFKALYLERREKEKERKKKTIIVDYEVFRCTRQGFVEKFWEKIVSCERILSIVFFPHSYRL